MNLKIRTDTRVLIASFVSARVSITKHEHYYDLFFTFAVILFPRYQTVLSLYFILYII